MDKTRVGKQLNKPTTRFNMGRECRATQNGATGSGTRVLGLDRPCQFVGCLAIFLRVYFP